MDLMVKELKGEGEGNDGFELGVGVGVEHLI
jgi:hypothetical protein